MDTFRVSKRWLESHKDFFAPHLNSLWIAFVLSKRSIFDHLIFADLYCSFLFDISTFIFQMGSICWKLRSEMIKSSCESVQLFNQRQSCSSYIGPIAHGTWIRQKDLIIHWKIWKLWTIMDHLKNSSLHHTWWVWWGWDRGWARGASLHHGSHRFVRWEGDFAATDLPDEPGDWELGGDDVVPVGLLMICRGDFSNGYENIWKHVIRLIKSSICELSCRNYEFLMQKQDIDT